MKRYKLEYHPKARYDICATYFYIADSLYAEEAANRWMERIMNAILSISEQPNSYRLCDETHFARFGFRKMIVRNHIILYTVTNDTVTICRVVDGRRDLTKITM